jgi:formylglycine-generating enzyme required for sulfatase activity
MLPTEAQWEYAARGPEAWIYPWGNEFDGTRLNYCDGDCPHEWRDPDQVDGFARTASVETLPQGASWVGALHMSGNVWEWDADWYDELYYGTLGAMTQDPTGPATGSTHGVRSSAWSNYAVFTHAARRASNCPPDLVGFRVAAAFPAP